MIDDPSQQPVGVQDGVIVICGDPVLRAVGRRLECAELAWVAAGVIEMAALDMNKDCLFLRAALLDDVFVGRHQCAVVAALKVLAVLGLGSNLRNDPAKTVDFLGRQPVRLVAGSAVNANQRFGRGNQVPVPDRLQAEH
ncbi:hypothetical protein D3C73_1075600 [compost metagenome]